MFRRKPSNTSIDTLIGVSTRIDGNVDFSGGMHLDGYINGNVTGSAGLSATLSVSEHGGIEGSVSVTNVTLNGIVKGDIDAIQRVDLGEKARVLGSVRYSVLETAVGAQINGKLIHRPESPASQGDTDPADEP